MSFLMGGVLYAANPFTGDMKPKNVAAVCDAVANWQIQHHHESKHHILDWTNGTLYRGMTEWGKTAGNQQCYDFVEKIGEANKWNMWDRVYHAEDICVGQAFIEMYRKTGDAQILQSVKEKAFYIASHPSNAPLLKTDPIGKDERWSWCDALFMAPPMFAAL
jgi:rhamnogalacturonyl hydrolase YesR